MRKVALVFVVAVFVPSLALAWLAVRTLQDQQFLLERQQALLYQHVADSLAGGITARLAKEQQDFSTQTEEIFSSNNADLALDSRNGYQRFTAAANAMTNQFDRQIRQRWPLAEVGFGVTTAGAITCPGPTDGAAAEKFLQDNSAFLCNQQTAEVFLNNPNHLTFASSSEPYQDSLKYKNGPSPSKLKVSLQSAGQSYWLSKAQPRTVVPQNSSYQTKEGISVTPPDANLSTILPTDIQFRELIANDSNGLPPPYDGMLARFLQNKLELIFWHRLRAERNYIFGAKLNLPRMIETMRDLVQTDPGLNEVICVAILDDHAKPVLLSHPGFQAQWKHPLVATEIGEALPHWEVAAYMVDPSQLTKAACSVELLLGLLIAVLVLAIGIGSLLIVRSLGAELKLARQKTDFVSNVSHELKTPLTSIRMFSELLAEGRVPDAEKQQSYLNIITAEAARLTRLINNVLDFSRMESGEKQYQFQPCDLLAAVRATVQTFRPHLEANGFQFECELPDLPLTVRGDADALAQVLVNLLSNAEKYSGDWKEIAVIVARRSTPVPFAEVRVLDRGSGVPSGSGEKIFEKFYRAHDSLSSGIQGSGLGLTLARQIARAHGGEVTYEARPGGGSVFSLHLPLAVATT